MIVKTDGSFAALTIVPRTASARYITVTTAAVNTKSRHRGDGAKLFYVFGEDGGSCRSHDLARK